MVETGVPCTRSPALSRMHSRAPGALPPDRRREVGESAVAVLQRTKAGVQIVGVQNGQGPDFRRRRSAAEQQNS